MPDSHLVPPMLRQRASPALPRTLPCLHGALLMVDGAPREGGASGARAVIRPVGRLR